VSDCSDFMIKLIGLHKLFIIDNFSCLYDQNVLSIGLHMSTTHNIAVDIVENVRIFAEALAVYRNANCNTETPHASPQAPSKVFV